LRRIASPQDTLDACAVAPVVEDIEEKMPQIA
jgi:hypothetical protein